jgi:hypothetical protein
MKLAYPFHGTFPITQRFGVNPQDYPATGGHMGIDWGIPLNTPIFPAAVGKVISAGWNNQGYGNLVIMEHADNIKTYYAHLSIVGKVANSVVDDIRLPLGHSGTTGNSTGPHLHFEYRVGNVPKNPLPLFTDEPDTDIPPVKPPTAKAFKVGDILKVDSDVLNIRAEAAAASKDLGDLVQGYRVKVIAVKGRWVRIKGEQEAWLCSDYLVRV